MLFRRKREPVLWIKAEEEFHRWIENPKDYQKNEHADLRISIHIYFRKKLKNLLAHYISRVYDKLLLQKLLAEEQEKEYQPDRTKFKSLYEQEVQYTPTTISEEEPECDVRFKIKSVADYNKEILDGIWEGDSYILHNFYSEVFPKVAWLILRNNGRMDDAKDILQDAMVILIEKYTWDKLDLYCSVKTYIYSICRNLWYENLRKQKKEASFTDLEQYERVKIPIDYYEEQPELIEQVSRAMESLNDSCKKLLELYYFGNHSWKEIASYLGYRNAASARNQKYKCLERIRKMVNGE
jgi:RNA polymerase sigma factor (sigma-70 family)